MSTGSSRFRSGHVGAPATPAKRIRRHVGDDVRLWEACRDLLPGLAEAADGEEIVRLLEVVRDHDDPHRVYAIHKLAASLLISSAPRSAPARPGSDAAFSWAGWFDIIPAALVPLLEQTPHEPELLNLLGLAYYELGETPVARRLFEAVREVEPEHVQARRNLKACKERARRGAGTVKVPERHTQRALEHRAGAKRVAERAVKLTQPSISLIMIVKDEEEMLPGCLSAVAGHVDEMIVVDTGSSDRTREIALEHGATVIDYPWTGSFSDARNRSLEAATGDWVLYLDADEHLVEEDGALLRQLVRKTWVEGFYLVETHYTGEFELGGQSAHMALRLFQHRPHYHFKGIIHEQKMHNFPTYLPERFQNSPIRVNHYGYLKDVIEDRDKRERNLQLLLQAAAENPDDAFTQFNIGSEYAAVLDWAAARPPFERALELSRADSGWQAQQFAPMMVSRTINARRGTGDDAAALQLIAEGLGYWPDFTDLRFERAVIHLTAGDLTAAREEALACLEMGDAHARYVAVKGKGSYQARALLATILRRGGDLAGARAQLEAAIDEAPHFLPNVLELADVMLQTDEPDEVEAYMDRVLGERVQGISASLLLATAFYEAGHLEHAERYYARVLDQQPDHATALVGMAELRLAQANPSESWNFAMRIDPTDPFATRGARTAFLAAVVEGNKDRLAEPLRIIQQAEYVPVGARAFYAAWHARVMGGSAVLSASPDAAAQVIANLEALAKLGAADEFEQLVPLLDHAVADERERHLLLGGLYLRRRFADMAAEEYMLVTQRFGPDPQSLTGLGKVATIKEMWEDAEVFLSESLKLDPGQREARQLLQLIRERNVG